MRRRCLGGCTRQRAGRTRRRCLGVGGGTVGRRRGDGGLQPCEEIAPGVRPSCTVRVQPSALLPGAPNPGRAPTPAADVASLHAFSLSRALRTVVWVYSWRRLQALEASGHAASCPCKRGAHSAGGPAAAAAVIEASAWLAATGHCLPATNASCLLLTGPHGHLGGNPCRTLACCYLAPAAAACRLPGAAAMLRNSMP